MQSRLWSLGEHIAWPCACTTCVHNMCTQPACTNCVHNLTAQPVCTTCVHNLRAQPVCTTCMHNLCAQPACTTCVHNLCAQPECTTCVCIAFACMCVFACADTNPSRRRNLNYLACTPSWGTHTLTTTRSLRKLTPRRILTIFCLCASWRCCSKTTKVCTQVSLIVHAYASYRPHALTHACVHVFVRAQLKTSLSTPSCAASMNRWNLQ